MLENRKALSDYRLHTALEKLDSAKLLLDEEKYKAAANRAYYAMFHRKEKYHMDNKLRLDGIFGSGMVLRRDVENKIWGWCPSDGNISVALDGSPCPVSLDGKRFTAVLPAREASTGHEIVISCRDEKITLSDVCFGEVYLLSGQSNMQLPVDRVLDRHGDEVRAANEPLIRHFTVEPRYLFGRYAEDIPAAEWKKAVYPEVFGFSAAGYFFGLRMYKELGVPIGLVLNAMGGATIEAWMPEESVKKFYDCTPQIEKYYREGACEQQIAEEQRLDTEWRAALAEADRNMPVDRVPDGAEPFNVPGMCFGTELEGRTGSAFFYREIELENEPSGGAIAYIGNSIEADETFINGVKIGETSYRYPPRKYTVPAGVLRKGKNLITVRLISTAGVCGFVSDHPYYLESGGERIGLEGQWLMKKGAECGNCPNVLFPPLLPTVLYNASFYPLRDMSFSAVLWYQGESNCNTPEDAKRYDEKFAELVRVWREKLGYEIPFVCTEMCDFDDPAVKVHDTEGWKEVQRQQREAPAKVPRCAAALCAVLGEPWELHPQRKKEVGERLAEALLTIM